MNSTFEHIYKEVTETLLKKLPKHLSYHSVYHTIYVLNRAVFIAKKMGVSSNDIQLIKVAALYHDIGFIKSHIEHEALGCKIARKKLKGYGYTDRDIETVCGMIMATKIPQQPKTALENILADADLEYLGTKHFKAVGELLYKELKHYNPDLTRVQWNDIQINFMSNHKYHTSFCKRYKQHRKLKNLQNLGK